MAISAKEGFMERYLLLGKSTLPSDTDTKGPTLRGSIEQLSRDVTVKATYGYIENSNAVLALLCEVPSALEADELSAMARMYGLPQVDVLPLLPTEELRAELQEAERNK
jgi:hypothetical protein